MESPSATRRGNENADAIYWSVGKSLSTWEANEVTLAKMFGLFVESESQAAEWAYGIFSGNSGKKDALKYAAEIFSSRRNEKFSMHDFNLLLSHYQGGVARRNEIAHGIVQLIKIDNEERGYFLTPPLYNSRKGVAHTPSFWEKVRDQSSQDPFAVFGHCYRYTSQDIEHFTNLFAELQRQAASFFIEQLMIVGKEKFNRIPDSQKVTIQLGESNGPVAQ